MEKYYECLKDDEYKYGHEIEYFWINGVILVVIAVFGLIGNVLNLAVLFQRTFRKDEFYQLLIILSIFDTFFIISYAIDEGYYYMVCIENYRSVVPVVFCMFAKIGLVGSIYTTVMISVERYIGICWPFVKYHRKTSVYLVLIVVITLSYNMPRFLDVEYYVSQGRVKVSDKEWVTDQYKQRYYGLARSVIEDVLPLLIVTLLNGFVITEGWKRPKNLKDIENGSQIYQKEATKTLLTIVITFFLVRLVSFIASVTFYLHGDDRDFRTKWDKLNPIMSVLYITNSSINFLLYCIVGKKFRNEFIRILCHKKKLNVSAGGEIDGTL